MFKNKKNKEKPSHTTLPAVVHYKHRLTSMLNLPQ